MKEILKDWKEKYRGEGHIDKPSRELVEAWLDAQLEFNKKQNEIMDKLKEDYEFSLFWGDLVDGDYESEIKPTGRYNNRDYVMIYKGIEMLADILGVELKEQKGWSIDYPYSYTFMYKGTMVQSIEKVPLPGFGDRRVDG